MGLAGDLVFVPNEGLNALQIEEVLQKHFSVLAMNSICSFIDAVVVVSHRLQNSEQSQVDDLLVPHVIQNQFNYRYSCRKNVNGVIIPGPFPALLEHFVSHVFPGSLVPSVMLHVGSEG